MKINPDHFFIGVVIFFVCMVLLITWRMSKDDKKDKYGDFQS